MVDEAEQQVDREQQRERRLARDAGGQPRSICGTRPALTLIAAATSRWAGRGSHGDRDLPLLRSGSIVSVLMNLSGS
jgi:hypothetical protein